MSSKNLARCAGAPTRTRLKIREVGAVRLTVHRTNTPHLRPDHLGGGRQGARRRFHSRERSQSAAEDGSKTRRRPRSSASAIAQKAKEQGIESVAFDRAGYKYHGRVKALAEAARAGGLKF